MNLPPDSDGTWEVASSSSDLIELRFGTETRQLEGKVLFRDKDEFTLKLKNAGALSPQGQTQETQKFQKQPTSSLVFKRVKE